MNVLKHNLLGLASFLILTSCGSNQSKPDQQVMPDEPVEMSDEYVTLDEYCSEFTCRKNIVIQLMTNAGLVEQSLAQYWPVVQGDRLSLLPGDKVYIEAELSDGQFVNLNRVEAITDPERTMVFDFSQSDDGVDMFLSVSNPFDQVMKYHLDMLDFEGNFHQTSSCAIMPGTGVFEHWPHPIPELIVSNIRALAEADNISCEY